MSITIFECPHSESNIITFCVKIQKVTIAALFTRTYSIVIRSKYYSSYVSPFGYYDFNLELWTDILPRHCYTTGEFFYQFGNQREIETCNWLITKNKVDGSQNTKKSHI